MNGSTESNISNRSKINNKSKIESKISKRSEIEVLSPEVQVQGMIGQLEELRKSSAEASPSYRLRRLLGALDDTKDGIFKTLDNTEAEIKVLGETVQGLEVRRLKK